MTDAIAPPSNCLADSESRGTTTADFAFHQPMRVYVYSLSVVTCESAKNTDVFYKLAQPHAASLPLHVGCRAAFLFITCGCFLRYDRKIADIFFDRNVHGTPILVLLLLLRRRD